MSFTWWNCVRVAASGLMAFGQDTASGVRVPPKCEATSLVAWYGVLPAHAQPAWYMLSALLVPRTSRPPSSFSARMWSLTSLGMPFCAKSSLMVPFWPSAEEPLSLNT